MDNVKKIFVTGGTGFLGGYLLKELLNTKDEIYALKRKTLPTPLKDLPIKWVEGDITDATFMDKALEGMHYVYHCAALVSFQSRFKEEMMRVNIQGTANVVNACITHNIQKLVHVSSVAALGRTDDHSLITENTPWQVTRYTSAYGISKHEAEMEVWRGINEGLKAIVLCPSIILGCGDWTMGSAALFRQVYDGLKFYPLGKTGFVDVMDVTKAMIIAINSSINGEKYIVSADNVLFKHLLDMIAGDLHVKKPFIPVNDVLKNIYGILDALQSKLKGQMPLTPRDTLRSINLSIEYDNSKIKKDLGISFTPVTEVILRVCKEIKLLYNIV